MDTRRALDPLHGLHMRPGGNVWAGNDDCGNPYCVLCYLRAEVVRLAADNEALREILARLSHAVGQWIESDERPRPVELWGVTCEAQQIAAVYLNTGEVLVPAAGGSRPSTGPVED